MDDKLEYYRLIKSMTSCKTLSELKDVLKDVNAYITDNKIPNNSKEYKKLEQVLHLMRIKLKRENQNENNLTKIIKSVIHDTLNKKTPK
jgi:hypothetical protein